MLKVFLLLNRGVIGVHGDMNGLAELVHQI